MAGSAGCEVCVQGHACQQCCCKNHHPVDQPFAAPLLSSLRALTGLAGQSSPRDGEHAVASSRAGRTLHGQAPHGTHAQAIRGRLREDELCSVASPCCSRVGRGHARIGRAVGSRHGRHTDAAASRGLQHCVDDGHGCAACCVQVGEVRVAGCSEQQHTAAAHEAAQRHGQLTACAWNGARGRACGDKATVHVADWLHATWHQPNRKRCLRLTCLHRWKRSRCQTTAAGKPQSTRSAARTTAQTVAAWRWQG